MSWSRSYYIGQAFLKITGGVPTPDSSVRWGEAQSYFAMALNFVQVGNYWLETKAEGEHAVNQMLLVPFDNIAIQFLADQNRHYSDLPKDVLMLSKGRALKMTTMYGQICYPLVQGDEMLEKFYGKHKSTISYQLEGKRRVWWYNLPPLLENVRATYIVDGKDLTDDDLILLPSDAEVKLIDLIVEFLTGERQIPKDYTEDGKEN